MVPSELVRRGEDTSGESVRREARAVDEDIGQDAVSEGLSVRVPAGCDAFAAQHKRVTRAEANAVIARIGVPQAEGARSVSADIDPTGLANDHRPGMAGAGERYPCAAGVKLDPTHGHGALVATRPRCLERRQGAMNLTQDGGRQDVTS